MQHGAGLRLGGNSAVREGLPRYAVVRAGTKPLAAADPVEPSGHVARQGSADNSAARLSAWAARIIDGLDLIGPSQISSFWWTLQTVAALLAVPRPDPGGVHPDLRQFTAWCHAGRLEVASRAMPRASSHSRSPASAATAWIAGTSATPELGEIGAHLGVGSVENRGSALS